MSAMSERPNFSFLYTGLKNTFLAALAFGLAFTTSGIIKFIINPGETNGVLNLYSDKGFTPEQNYARLVVMIVLTLVYFFLLHRLLERSTKLFKAVIIVLAVFTVLAGDILPTIRYYRGNIDMFHQGEQISPGNAFNAGKNPYTDMFVIHGAGEDVVWPAMALRAAGDTNTGIGHYFFVRGIFMMIAAGLFLTLLAVLLKDPITFALAVTWFSFSAYSHFHYARDIFTWTSLLLVFHLLTGVMRNERYRLGLHALLGLIASTAILYSIERGIIGISLALLVGLISTFVERRDESTASLSLPRTRERFYPLLAVGAGLLAVQAIALLGMGWAQYSAFLQTYIVDIPRDQGLLFNYPLPEISEATIIVWIPIMFAALAALGFYIFVREDLRRRVVRNELLMALVLLAGSILFLRVGYGRSDIGHTAYSTPLLFAASFYIMQFIWRSEWRAQTIWIPVVMMILLFSPEPTAEINRASGVVNANPVKVAREYKDLLRTDDSAWIPAEPAAVTRYIKEVTAPTDPIFVFTQQPLYYYLTNRSNPTRYYIPWFADSNQLEQELLTSLQKQNPKLIVYSSGTFWDNIDGFSMQQRTPAVDQWILENYPQTTAIGGVVLRTKN